jgi:hypothetical protein
MRFSHAAFGTDRETANVAQRISRLSRLAVIAVSTALCATAAIAADRGASSDAKANYQKERAACNSGQSTEDRATCLREAGAALQEARRGKFTDDQAQFEQNALTRCEALKGDNRQSCERRMKEGTTSGSVGGGGIYREYRETVTETTPQSTSPSDSTSSGVSPSSSSTSDSNSVSTSGGTSSNSK